MAKVIALALLSISAMSQTIQPPASGGRIQGRVIDASGGSIAGFIRVIQTGADDVVLRVRADQTGSFRTEQLREGFYSVTAAAQGFRRRELTRIAVHNEAATDLGDIRLDFSGCDAPGVICDFFTDAVPSRAEIVLSSGYLRVMLTCGADFDGKGKVHCPETSADEKLALPNGVDIQFEKDGVHLSLVAVNGARMSMPDSSGTDYCGVPLSEGRLRLDALGLGVDFCVRTKGGAAAHVFFTNDVGNQDTEIVLWHVTRKR